MRAHVHVCAVTGNAELRTPGLLNALSRGHISCPLKQTLDPYVCHTIPPCESTSHETAIVNHLWLTDNGDSIEFSLIKPHKTGGLCFYANICLFSDDLHCLFANNQQKPHSAYNIKVMHSVGIKWN